MSKDSKMVFEKGEKVLCYHGPLIYEAKCLEAEMQDSQAKYYIHYAGWNKNWDEWVPENRVLKYNDANIQKQKDLQKTLKSNPQSSRKPIKPRRADGKDGEPAIADKAPLGSAIMQDVPVTCAVPEAGRKKRGRGDNADMQTLALAGRLRFRLERTAGQAGSVGASPMSSGSNGTTPKAEPGVKAEVVTTLPDTLKVWLGQEYNYIHKEDKLVILPARKTVMKIATEYFDAKVSNTEEDPFVEQVVGEVLDGLMDHFSVALPAELLYPLEKTQFKEISEKYPDTPLYEIYGGSHFLRMLAKFGSKLGSPRFDEFTTDLLLQYINEFLRFIADNQDNFLRVEDYRVV